MIRFLFMLIGFFVLSHPVAAQEKIDLSAWSQLPVLHEGRIKPIDSFARINLKKLSTRDNIDGLSANQWLAETLFMPDESVNRAIFKIRDNEIIKLAGHENRLYSYIEIMPALEANKETIESLLNSDANALTAAQQDLLNLYNNAILYGQLLRAMTAILPLSVEDNEIKNYLDIKGSKDGKFNAIKNVIFEGGSNNLYFKIIPQDWDNRNKDWQTIWQAIQQNPMSEENISFINQWKKLAISYRADDGKEWNEAINQLSIENTSLRLRAEYFYNVINFLNLAIIFYALSFALIILYQLTSQKNIFKIISLSALALGSLSNGLDIALRIYILNRPPVGTLFESIIFVSLICVIGFLILERKGKNNTGVLLGSITGAALLIIAKSFAGEDSMNTLVAVLNTNFWLLTHVICITAGYAVCFLSSMTAHYFLALKIMNPAKSGTLNLLQQNIKTLNILALLFTTIGTILGGIWADQSWGRFWGWDPKENGALLIVLWLIWIIHGKISKHINETGYIVGTACLSIVVVLAWFGVNLLSVGLHSYGFITGVKIGIVSFCTIEAVIITSLWYGNYQKDKR